MKDRPFVLVITVALTLLSAFPSGAASFSVPELVSKGNAAYHQRNYEDALSYYDEASVEAPESAHLAFNRGTVLYQKEDYEAAKEAFQDAALRAKQPRLGARAQYNLGNCAFREAQRQRDSDLSKAIESCQSAIRYYQEAKQLDPQFVNAAENIEIVRLYVKDLLDEQKKQLEEQQQQEDQEDEIVKKLKELIERQQAAVAANQSLTEAKPKETSTDADTPPGIETEDHDADAPDADPSQGGPSGEAEPNAWKEALDALIDDQSKIQEDTGTTLQDIEQKESQIQQMASQSQAQAPAQGQPAPVPDPAAAQELIEKLTGAKRHVADAINAQAAALESLGKKALAQARPEQTKAAEKLVEALQELSEKQPPQSQSGGGGDQDQQQEQQDGDDKQDENGNQNQQQNSPDQEQQETEDTQNRSDSMTALDEQARDILDEEKENRERRQPVRSGAYRPVDKDW